MYLRLRDELETLYQNELFANLSLLVVRILKPAFHLVLVTVTQILEGLLDRQAAEVVRIRLLGLVATEAGFHYSLLSELKSCLLIGNTKFRLFEVLPTPFKACGLLTCKS